MAITGWFVALVALGVVPVVVLESGWAYVGWVALCLVLMTVDAALAASPRAAVLERSGPDRVRLTEQVEVTLLVTNGSRRRLRGVIRDGVTAGVELGDVDPAADPDLIVDTLMAAYAWNYRLAAWEDASPERMSGVMDAQIALIARGFTPGRAAS